MNPEDEIFHRKAIMEWAAQILNKLNAQIVCCRGNCKPVCKNTQYTQATLIAVIHALVDNPRLTKK